MNIDWKKRLPWFISLGLLAITLAVYWGVLSCAFVNYDDNSYVTDNFHVQDGLTLRGLRWAFNVGYAANWHPLTWLSHMADYQLFGANPRGHHLTNLALHLANTLLLFGLLRRTTGALWPSAMVAALFAWHPAHVESVAWVAERKDLLCTFFFLLTLSAYARYAESRSLKSQVSSLKPQGGDHGTVTADQASGSHATLHAPPSTPPASVFYLLSLSLFALALMSKPMAVTLPFILLLLDYWPLGRLRLPGGAPENQRPVQFKAQGSSSGMEPSRVTGVLPNSLSRQKVGRAVPCAPPEVTQTRAFRPPSHARGAHGVLALPGNPVGQHALTPAGAKPLSLWTAALEKLPFFALALAASAVTMEAQGRAGAVATMEELPFAPRCGNALVSYLRYAGELLWPHDLSVIYPYVDQWPVWLIGGAAGLLLAVSWLALKLRRPAPYFPVGWFWFLGTLVPVIGLVQVGAQAMADRYTYIPSIGFFLVICWAAPQLLRNWPLRKPALVIAAAVVLCACARLTQAQVAYWQDSVSLFEHAVAVTQDNAAAHSVLGAGLAAKNRLDKAIDHYHIALRLTPGQGITHYNLGLALARLGRYDEAVIQYQSALTINPQDFRTHYDLANALNPEYVEENAVAAPTSPRRTDVKQAREHYLSALALDPDFVNARINLANLEASVGNYHAAIRCYHDALRTDPRSAKAHYNLAATLADPAVKLDQKDELILKHLREALRSQPDWVAPLNNLAWRLATNEKKELRNGPEAVRLATRACELTGYQNARVLGTLDAAYAETGRFDEAIDTARKGGALAQAAGETNLADAARARLKLYEAGKPYHQGASGTGQ